MSLSRAQILHRFRELPVALKIFRKNETHACPFCFSKSAVVWSGTGVFGGEKPMSNGLIAMTSGEESWMMNLVTPPMSPVAWTDEPSMTPPQSPDYFYAEKLAPGYDGVDYVHRPAPSFDRGPLVLSDVTLTGQDFMGLTEHLWVSVIFPYYLQDLYSTVSVSKEEEEEDEEPSYYGTLRPVYRNVWTYDHCAVRMLALRLVCQDWNEAIKSCMPLWQQLWSARCDQVNNPAIEQAFLVSAPYEYGRVFLSLVYGGAAFKNAPHQLSALAYYIRNEARSAESRSFAMMQEWCRRILRISKATGAELPVMDDSLVQYRNDLARRVEQLDQILGEWTSNGGILQPVDPPAKRPCRVLQW